MIQKNLLANFLGKGWTALLSFIFVPLYINFMGIESYGLIGLYASLMSLSTLFDVGLGHTLNRELARLSALGAKAEDLRGLVLSFEWTYWAVAIGGGVLIFLLSPLVASRWLSPEELSVDVVEQAIYFMVLPLISQWAFSLYSSALMGLQKHFVFNGIAASAATLRGGGSLLVLWLVSPTIQAFFIWQSIVGLIQIFFASFFLWKHLPKGEEKATFDWKHLQRVRRFAGGVGTINLLWLLFCNLDKIILSKMLSLETFGYYCLAATVASGLTHIISPLFATLYPRFSQLVVLGDRDRLGQLYRQSTQWMATLLLPLTIILIFFSSEILYLWTGNAKTVENTSDLVSLLSACAALNGLCNLPLALQLAYGGIKGLIYQNIGFLLLGIPVMFWSCLHYGAFGAAFVGIFLNFGFASIAHWTQKNFFQTPLRGSLQDMIPPLLAPLVLAFLVKTWARSSLKGEDKSLLFLACLTLLALFISALLGRPSRQWLRKNIFNR